MTMNIKAFVIVSCFGILLFYFSGNLNAGSLDSDVKDLKKIELKKATESKRPHVLIFGAKGLHEKTVAGKKLKTQVKELTSKKVIGHDGGIIRRSVKPIINKTTISRPEYKKDEVIVTYKKGVKKTSAAFSDMLIEKKLSVKKRFNALSSVNGKNIVVIKSEGGMKATEMVKLLEKNPLVESVSFNYIKYLNMVGCEGTTPNDSLFDYQWPLCNVGQEIAGSYGTPDADIDATRAWSYQTGSENVVIAVLDTGVDYQHPDLAANMWINPNEIPGDGIDNDGNGYVDDIYGIDTGDNDSDPMDIHGHGTHVAGTIAAKGNNGQGVAGINWNAKIMAVKGFVSNGYMYTDAEIEALDYIIAMKQAGVNIVAINASYGGFDFDVVQKSRIEDVGTKGIMFVAAAGNDGVNNDTYPHYPSSYDLDNIISVAATDKDDNLTSWSNYGINSVDIAAPGNYILSTYPDIYYIPAYGDLFFDDMESGNGNWSAEGTWTITEEYSTSPTHAWSDSPGGNYVENANYSLITNPIDLSGATGSLSLGFVARFDLEEEWDWLHIYYEAPAWERTNEQVFSGTRAWSDSPRGNYDNYSDNWLISPIVDISNADTSTTTFNFALTGIVEQDYDYLDIYLSNDGGNNWNYYGSLTGEYADWWCISFPILPEFLNNQFRVAFVLWSDGGVTDDGFYIDDVWIEDDSNQFFYDNMDSVATNWTTQSWEYKGSITGSSDGNWYLFNEPIDKKYFHDHFRMKCELWTNELNNRDGVYIDDVGIGNPVIDHTYAYMGGTSMAAPHVAGTVAFLAADFPSEDLLKRKNRILSGVDLLPSLGGKVVTEGRLNLYNSMARADLNGDGDVDKNDRNIFKSALRTCEGDAGFLPQADYDGNGCISIKDYREWYKRWKAER